jgi:DNA-binding transcriptional LysR family regulator
MDTRDLAILVHAARTGSLSAAARRLEITPMIASRRLAALERQVGVRLMHRTTRAVSLTPEGESFLEYASAMLETEEAARAVVAPVGAGVSGLLRVTAPAAFGRKVIAPLVPLMLQDNPGLRIDLHLTDSVVDIVAAGFDVAVRIGRLQDSSLIARRLAPNIRLLCASPAYLSRAGTPEKAADLADHECLTLTGVSHWPFDVGSRRREVKINGRFSSSSIEAVHAACLHGMGLALLSSWDADEDIRSGVLRIISLRDAKPQELAISVVYPTSRMMPRKVELFIQTLSRRLG